MLPTILQYTTQLSLAAFALVSIFNIGYFSRIGLHFLGLVDLTNIVYSFAIVLAVLLALLQIFTGDVIENLRGYALKQESMDHFFKFSFKYLLPVWLTLFGVTSCIAVGWIPGTVFNASADDVSALAFVSLWIWVATGTFIKINSPNLRVQAVDYSSNLFLSIISTLGLGRALASFPGMSRYRILSISSGRAGSAR